MTPIKAVWAGISGAAACLVLAVPAVAASHQAARCSTRGIASSKSHGLRVVSLTAKGVSCAKAAGLARELASDLALGKPVSVSGSAALSMTQTTTCSGCATDTRVTLSYADGAVITLALKGHVKSPAAGSMPFPAIPGFPGFPYGTPGSSGGTTTV